MIAEVLKISRDLKTMFRTSPEHKAKDKMQENFREKMKQNPEVAQYPANRNSKKGQINIYINMYISIYICLEAIDD